MRFEFGNKKFRDVMSLGFNYVQWKCLLYVLSGIYSRQASRIDWDTIFALS